ncbi:MAG: ECF transporter S component [Mycetocola sp.]
MTTPTTPTDAAHGQGTARPAQPGTSRYSTKTLMVCAALAAVFAVAFGGYTFFEAAILPVAPMVIIFTSGMWFALPLLAMLFIRRAGSGIITAGIAGLLAGFVSPYGWQLLLFAVAYALVVEIPFAITRWRRFGFGMIATVTVVMWLISIGMYWTMLSGSEFPIWLTIILVALQLVTYLAWSLVASWLARALRRALPTAV